MIHISSEDKIDIEHHFKVSAGPGAGKTHWLVNHIKSTLKNSERLEKTRKIACITYTNVAVETILNRLGTQSINQVEVSTIHSFLYCHVVKPYLFHIAEVFGVDFQKIKGHDNIKPKYTKVQSWLENHSMIEELKHPYTIKQLLMRQDNKQALFNWLSSTKYSFNSDLTLKLRGEDRKAQHLRNIIRTLEMDLLSYKKLYWQDGKIDHDDVLYFSYELIKRCPFILKVLSAKFPYFFIDEFQDTNPIQAKIVSLLAKEETIIGVIGDPAQSIYSFQGASIEDYLKFKIDNLSEYTITENRRSSNQIIDLLNEIRTDIVQTKFRNIDHDKPILFIGNSTEAYSKILEIYGDDIFIQTLSRDNPTANSMKFAVDNSNLNTKLLVEFDSIDSNDKRYGIIKTSMEALEFAKQGDYKNAIKIMSANFSDYSEKEQINKSVLILQKLIQIHETFFEKPLMEFYKLVKEDIKMSGFKKGPIQDFYNQYSYKEVALCINYKEDISQHRTIHKSKGDEFQNVLLIPDKIEFLTNPNLNEDEEHRIYYVGISRAKDRLFVVIPKLLKKEQKLIKSKFDFQIIELEKEAQLIHA
ncbi:ATP-dependent helicase (plasmid) [Bacillus sp. ZJS3]|uniref:UvrD-helicase domain-containing protein n=1 Tax=Bacillus sp. ZJS3 TaxID=2928154 RepID=UPI001FB554AD|nr:ATP-dependent helicase [Bacillus sp. ZJS3]UOB81736.1 ATP-dependent helicase [Bacillus sp. ZJS3]